MKRDQAENVEMRGTRRGPSPQQNVNADPEVDERNQPQPVIQWPLGRSQDHPCLNGNRVPDHRVRCLRPHTRGIELPLQTWTVGHVAAVDRAQLVAAPDSGLVRRTIPIDPVRDQVSTMFHPPRAVRGNLKCVFFLKVNPGKNAGGGSQQEQQAGGKTDLEVLVHGPVGRHQRVPLRRVFASPQVYLQLRCHDPNLSQVAN